MNKNKHWIGWILLIAVLLMSMAAVVNIHHNKYVRQTELLVAAQSGDLEKVKFFIKQGDPINQKVESYFGWTPLIAAIYGGETNAAQYLVEAGADVNLADMYGKTPLMYAALHGDEAAPLAQSLIAHGANLDAKDNHGATAFDCAGGVPASPAIIEVLAKARQEQKKLSQK